MKKEHKYILGIKPDGSPRFSLSYSGWDLWKRDRQAYRRRYYENEPSFTTVETVFGKLIAEKIESGDPEYQWIPHYSTGERTIDVEIEGAHFNGRPDSIDLETGAFLDHKTGHVSREGKPPWDRVKVAKHKQLDFYSMIIKEKFGKVKNRCHIVWLETEFKKKSTEFAGHTLETQTRELYLTGKMKKFPRVIQEWQRKKIKVELLQAVKEIHDDYQEYRKKSGRSGIGEAITPEVSTGSKVLQGHGKEESANGKEEGATGEARSSQEENQKISKQS